MCSTKKYLSNYVTTMTQQLERSPATRVNRDLLPAGFLGDLPFPPPLHPGAAPCSPHLTLIGSQYFIVKSRPNFTALRLRAQRYHDYSILPAATVMVLANAIYFKSPWLKKFEKSLTNNNTFSVDPTRNVTVPFMYQEDSFLYGSSEELKVKWVELLFKDTNYSLLVVLPNERFGLADVLANLTSSHISGMLQGGSWTGVRLYLPRFNLNSNTKLVSALKELGIRDVFESGLSDLSGISASKEPLSVSDVVQKATMEIDEDGGVASAATVVEFVALSSLVFLDSEEFRTDHQFLAVIVNKNGNVPLFMATIVDPSVD